MTEVANVALDTSRTRALLQHRVRGLAVKGWSGPEYVPNRKSYAAGGASAMGVSLVYMRKAKGTKTKIGCVALGRCGSPIAGSKRMLGCVSAHVSNVRQPDLFTRVP